MPEIRHSNGDVVAVPDQLVEYYERQGWERKLSPAEIENLRGADLEQALADHDLPTSGKVADKRARLAEDQEN